MRRLMFDGPGRTRWEEVEEPELSGPAGALVRPIAVATCDLDVAVLRGSYPLPGPYPLGHEGVAEVVAVGDEVSRVAPGDRVIVPFQISCGQCAPCLRGRTGNCAAHALMSSYGLGPLGGQQWGGLLADLVLVPHADAMLVPLPDTLDPVAVASASDNIPDAWRTVGPGLAEDPGAEVLVVGGDAGPCSIGLYAVGIAVALGASRVVYADAGANPTRGSVAEAFGAEVIGLADAPRRKVGSFPITVDASGTPEGLRLALDSTALDGTCTSPSIYLTDVELPLLRMYSRGCTFVTGRAHARGTLPAVLEAFASGFDPSPVTTTVARWEDAAQALNSPSMKTVVHRTS